MNEIGLPLPSRVQKNISPGILLGENFKLGRKEDKAKGNSKDNNMAVSSLKFEVKLNLILRKFRKRIRFP